MKTFLVVIGVISAAFCGLLSAQTTPPTEGFDENFSSSPFDFEGGRWTIEGPGWENGQFEYDAESDDLICRFNSLLPTTKLVIPLGSEYDSTQSFFCSVVMTIESSGFEPQPDCMFPIAFGLINRETTGTDRCGGSSFDGGDDDTYDMVEWDFWPNVSEMYGGPYLGPTIVGGRVGDAWWYNYAFLPSLEDTDLSDEIDEGLLPPTGLPLDTPLRLEMWYEAGHNAVFIEAHEWAGGEWVLLRTRVPGTVTKALDPQFLCDGFSISLYEDAYNPNPETPSVLATVRFHEVHFGSGGIQPRGAGIETLDPPLNQ